MRRESVGVTIEDGKTGLKSWNAWPQRRE